MVTINKEQETILFENGIEIIKKKHETCVDLSHFGLYKENTLFYTSGGTFAADAWIASDGQSCGDVLGTRFDAITADDGKEYNLGRHNVSPVTVEKLIELLPKAHIAFRITLQFERKRPRSISAYQNWIDIKSFGFISKALNDGHSVSDIVEFIENKFF